LAQFLPQREPPEADAAEGPVSGDLELVVRHLQSLITAASTVPPALVVVTIGNADVAWAAVDALATRITAKNLRVVVVNESGRPRPGTVEPEAIADDAETGDEAADRATTMEGNIVLVVAALHPAKGADHLREWGGDAVALVTAGRSTATTLESNATMIRAAGLHLRSVVLLGSDPSDDSLGVFDPGPAPSRRTVGTAPDPARVDA
jgi:hypothetical protein